MGKGALADLAGKGQVIAPGWDPRAEDLMHS